jgi:hypothetical protein
LIDRSGNASCDYTIPNKVNESNVDTVPEVSFIWSGHCKSVQVVRKIKVAICNGRQSFPYHNE